MDVFFTMFFTKLEKTAISELQLSDEEDNHFFTAKCFTDIVKVYILSHNKPSSII